MATGSALSDSWSNHIPSLHLGPGDITFNAFLSDFTPCQQSF